MGLVVGQNSYVTVAEADEIIASRFMSISNERKLWNSLSEEDKSILIVTTTEKYDNDNMMYKGTKVEIEQALQFPRVINSKLVDCPETIKAGLIIQCIKDLVADSSEERQLIKSGVTKYKIKDAEVSFKDDAFNIGKNSLGFDADIWKQYFSAWSEYGKFIAL